MLETFLPGLSDVCAAAMRIRDHLHRTPLVPTRTLSEWTGCQLFLKCENLQKTGSFKPRGGINRIATLSDEARQRGVITISAGNHAQGVAYAACAMGVSAVVVMPETATASKVAATRDYGAECILHGDVQAAFVKLKEIQEERNLTLVHPFDDPLLVAGHGTVGWEIYQQLAEVDAVICGVGGGGLISGIATAIKALSPNTRIYGVEPEGAPTMSEAVAAGSPVHLERVETIADGLAPPFVGALNLAVVQQSVESIIKVSDDAIRAAMKALLERTKLLVEPAGAAPLAALLQGRLPFESKQRVVVVLSGGNVDVDQLPTLLNAPRP
ncbi:MAG: threonine/serine dehydratase [Acidobacteriota bacterium]